MVNIQYNEDKDNALNRKIADIWAAKTYEECKQLVREVYEIGVDDGQTFYQNLRAGRFHYEDGTPGPGFEEPPPCVITTNGAGQKDFIIDENGHLQEYAEIVSGKLVLRTGNAEDWGKNE